MERIVSDQAAFVGHVAEILRDGGMVVLPSETSYYAVSSYMNTYVVHQNSSQTPLLFLGALADLSEYAVPFERVRRIADATLPGPLVLQVLAQPDIAVPNLLNEEMELCCTIPSDPLFRSVVQALGAPLVGTPCGYVPEDVPEAELLFDVGALTGGRVRTIVRVAGENDADLTLVQEGVVPFSAVLRA